MNNNVNELDKLKLTGRLYPAIESCVNNRYKIVISIFAYYAFIINIESESILSKIDNIQKIMSIIFSLFIIYNYINYAKNAYEIQEIEKLEKPKKWFTRSILEFIFGIIMLIIIWLAYCIIKFN